MYWAIGAVVAIFLAFCIGFISGMTSMENALLKEGFRVHRNNDMDVGNGRVLLERRDETGAWRVIKPIEKKGDPI
jgi:hypothetical protein